MLRIGRILVLLMLGACSGHERVASPAVPPMPTKTKPEDTLPSDEFSDLEHRYTAVPSIRSFNGKGTYYANSLAGNKMASGEVYDPTRPLAAHRTLAFGTIVRVTNVRSGQSVIVRIADRGPFSKGRVIDLSHAAAERIGLIRVGVAQVRVDVLETPTR